MIIYKITNNLNGKTYIGMDAANNPSYFGSGVAIKQAIKKYGKKNFNKEILETGFSSYDEMAKAEVKWIALERKSNKNGIYNLNDGGLGCSANKGKKAEDIYGLQKSLEWKAKISNTLKQKDIKPPSRLGCKGSDLQKEAVRKTAKNRIKTVKEIENLIARTVRPIICLQNGVHYKSLKDAATSLCLSKSNISSVLSGKRKHTKGFTFEYLERK